MNSQRYYPTREGEQLTWFINLREKAPAYYTTLEITPPRQAKLVLTLDWLIWTWSVLIPTRRSDGLAATSWRSLLATGSGDTSTAVFPPVPAVLTPPVGEPYFGMLTWLFEEIGRWKAAEGYHETIGRDLGVVGGGRSAPDLTTIRPLLTAVVRGGGVGVGWGWQGFSEFLDLCEILVNRNDGKGYVLLTYDSTPNYEDNFPHPDAPVKWLYKAIYRVADHQVGQWSAEVSVVVGG